MNVSFFMENALLNESICFIIFCAFSVVIYRAFTRKEQSNNLILNCILAYPIKSYIVYYKHSPLLKYSDKLTVVYPTLSMNNESIMQNKNIKKFSS